VAQNLFLGRQPTRFGFVQEREMRRRATLLLKDFSLDIDVSASLGDYSVAVQQITAIARAIDMSARVLILDEPTASLDQHEVEILFAVMRQLARRGIGIVFVTHFLDQVYAISDRITVLRNGRLVGERETAALPRMELVRMMLDRELSDATAERTHLPVDPMRAPYATFSQFGKSGYLAPFDLDLRSGEVVGLAGLLGSGRTETARLVFGVERADFGAATVDGREIRLHSPRDAAQHGFGYCPEERKAEGIVAELTARENIVLALQARRGLLRPLSRREQDEIAKRFIKLLDIRPPDPERPIGLLSGDLWLELDAILAVVIGGTSLFGGRFSLVLAVLGALIIQAMNTGILLSGFPPEFNLVVKAVVVLVVLLMQSPRLADLGQLRSKVRK
jgi:monosaccharide-transporting ATPase